MTWRRRTIADDGSPIILYNPNVLTWFHPKTRQFWYMHECGHHALAHAIRNIPLTREQESDCFSIVFLVKEMGYRARDVAIVQSDLSKAGAGDWTHLPGPQRAINLQLCLDDAGGGGSPTRVEPCTHLAHPMGHPTPCIHGTLHQFDAVPCSHACFYYGRAVPCHAADALPCGHPVHPGGDVSPCNHLLHPEGHPR